MGYTTDFEGSFDTNRRFTDDEYETLMEFNDTSHDGGYPSHYCQWIPTEHHDGIEWDGGEKFYEYVEWLSILIDKFLVPWGITLNGTVRWQGDDFDDLGKITIKDNAIIVEELEPNYN